ncbi:MAG: hypothetical protein J6K20_05045 [Thermoguttaceae bacterium]|nr:hypothetical protein [Thermoguttaceae bacterium]
MSVRAGRGKPGVLSVRAGRGKPGVLSVRVGRGKTGVWDGWGKTGRRREVDGN